MQSLLDFIRKYANVTDSLALQLQSHAKEVQFAPEDILLNEGDKCNDLWFIESGFLRFSILQNGEEKVKFITESPYLVTSQYSFYQGVPAAESIIAISKVKGYKIAKKIALSWMEQENSWQEFITQLTREVQFYTEQILEEKLSLSPEERYLRILQLTPHWFQHIPLKYIASYLGIAQPSLSRIRARI